jgi:ferredoxin-NADP reductase/predicted pyridoxine 5'-phosphate oxidase superfamily flavin-nucleotide-binding protein
MKKMEIYHDGELRVQRLARASDEARISGQMINKAIPSEAIEFIMQQTLLVIGSIDPCGQVWASVIFGQAGFLQVESDQQLQIDVSQTLQCNDDPLWNNLRQNPGVGLLIIELDSRRRLRINGRARKLSATRYAIDVASVYPNCPKYIQRRQSRKLSNATLEKAQQRYATPSTSASHGNVLSTAQQLMITSADTFFVASAHPEQGVDASHRGGQPGFVQLLNERELRIPDFPGNHMFNTLGNFDSYPHAGLVFINFKHRRLLQLIGQPKILWDLDEPHDNTGGTCRFWQFTVSSWREHTQAFDLDWVFLGYSPHIPEQREHDLYEPVLDSSAEPGLTLRVEHINRENEHIKSFSLTAVDGELLPEYQPGAHLQMTIKLPDGSRLRRHYSLLSNAADRSHYEIAVQLQPRGRGGSRYLHERIVEGDVLESRAPVNNFPMAGNARHSILIAGGIGITPILSMLHWLDSNALSYELHYSASSNTTPAFNSRIKCMAGDRVKFYNSQVSQKQRMDLQHMLLDPKPGTHVYVCGPQRLINSVRETATAAGWPAHRIHFESFGIEPSADDKAIQVHLTKSKKTLTVAANQSILDALLDAGIKAAHNCKRGECGLCATQVLQGLPDHRDLCLGPEQRESSMCICVSRAQGFELQLNL